MWFSSSVGAVKGPSHRSWFAHKWNILIPSDFKNIHIYEMPLYSVIQNIICRHSYSSLFLIKRFIKRYACVICTVQIRQSMFDFSVGAFWIMSKAQVREISSGRERSAFLYKSQMSSAGECFQAYESAFRPFSIRTTGLPSRFENTCWKWTISLKANEI